MGEIIAICSGKGGVGKSTISAMLGLAISKRHKALIIDGDLGLTNLDLIFKIKAPRYDISDVVDKRCMIVDTMKPINKNLDLVNLYHESSIEMLNVLAMKNIVLNLSKMYDYLILDCPAGIEKGFKFCMSIATKAIVVLNPISTSLRDGNMVSELILNEHYKEPYFILNRASEKDYKRVLNIYPKIGPRLLLRIGESMSIYKNNFPNSILEKFYRSICYEEENKLIV